MSKKRVTVKLKTPNPLFEKWLIEWRDEAKAKESKMQYCFSLALQNLKKYPLPLESGRDCKILKGFGDKLCKMLDEKLIKYKNGELDKLEVKNKNDRSEKNLRNEDKTEIKKNQNGNKKDLKRKENIPDISELINNEIIDLNQNKNKNQNKVKNTVNIVTQSNETIIFEPGSFEIILLVDTAETLGKNSKDDPIITDLTHLRVNFEVRHLKLGDYIWICRHNQTKFELVLPYIIERKRMDDFGHSIKDGRYHEQKFRLNQCGIQNVIYLVESFGKNTHVGLPLSTLMQASVNTMVQDGFSVKFCEDSRATAYYLSNMSKVIGKNYSVKTIVSCPKDNLECVTFQDDLIPALSFEEFMKVGAKHKKFTVKEMFIKHLIQLKGLSIDKALAIVDKYPTPRLLIEAYKQNPDSGEKLISEIRFGKGNKMIGPVISRVIYQLYSTHF